ncbi:VOC family protein [Streptomyces sp. NPDC050704]|uniref:VOC family protein n=1 Tax=Streptomyces sp. NPDC050704 TaxID=3157219 RepID=UPI00341E9CCE
MAVSLYQVLVDAHDLPSLARFWCQVLDWRVLFEAEAEIVIGAGPQALPGICFAPVGERKTLKNRLQIDLTPDGQAVEVERSEVGPPTGGWGRILALGARRVDVGQGEDATWVTLADPNTSDYRF